MQIICPVCKKRSTWEENPWKPFCSERCKLIDLGKWILEEYKIEGTEQSAEHEGQKPDNSAAKKMQREKR